MGNCVHTVKSLYVGRYSRTYERMLTLREVQSSSCVLNGETFEQSPGAEDAL